MKNKHDNRSLPANRNYKDTIFRWLFSDKNNLLSLYNAIAGAHYQNPEALNIVTLENAVYMDISLLTTPIFPCVIFFILQANISLL